MPHDRPPPSPSPAPTLVMGSTQLTEKEKNDDDRSSRSLSPPTSPMQAAVGAEGGLPDSDEDDDETQQEPETEDKDLEKGPSPSPPAVGHAPPEDDPNLVTWDGPNDPQNPKNWSFRQKWAVTATVSFFTLMSPVASSMLAPALPAISQEFGVKEGSVLSEMFLSIFVLAYAIGPLFLGPMSEILGRQPILQGSNIFFLIFNIACSRAQTTTQFLIFRFLAGLGGSAPLAIGGGTISDLFPPEQRGLATSLYTLAPLTGPALGPIAGAWIAQKTSWRWVFYASSIADGMVQIAGFILLRETYAPKVLLVKAKRLRKETGNPKLHTAYERPDRTFASVVGHGLLRPMRFLATEPIVQVLAAYMAVLYGLMYLTLATFASLWTTKYGMSVGVGGLNYLALGIGFTAGTQFGARLLDTIYIKLKKRNGGIGTPEMRMPLMMVTSLFVPVGLILYGWTADKHVFWLVPDIGVGIFAFGVIGSFLSIQTYLIDNFTLHAASAIAAGASLRSLAGFGFPLFSTAMFDKLGIGWGNSVLALVAFVFLPAPWLFYKYGPWLRSKSRFAKGQAAHAHARAHPHAAQPQAAPAPANAVASPPPAAAATGEKA